MQQQQLWSTLLKSASSANSIPSGTLLILGGTPKSQALLIQRIQRAAGKQDARAPRIANAFALGYTYVQFKDFDHDDKLSHLDIYTLPEQNKRTFLPLLQDLLARTLGGKPLLVTVLLDWETPPLATWAQVIATWLVLLRQALTGVDSALLDINKDSFRRRLQMYMAPSSDGTTDTKQSFPVEMPLEMGQYDLPLGVDLAFVATGAERLLRGDFISDDAIDYVQQFLRTIALKYGASVLYTHKTITLSEDSPSSSSSSQKPVVDNIVALLSERLELPVGYSQRIERLIPAVINADSIAIPAGWDSRGKIEAVCEGFNFQTMDSQWNHDTQTGTGKAVEYYENEILRLVGPEDEGYNQEKDSNGAAQVVTEKRTQFQEFMSKHYAALSAQESPSSKSADYYNIGGIQIKSADEVYRRLKQQEAANHEANEDVSSADVSMTMSSDIGISQMSPEPTGDLFFSKSETPQASSDQYSPTAIRAPAGGIPGFVPLGRPKGVHDLGNDEEVVGMPTRPRLDL